MAGIGFELQKLLRQGGIGSFFKVAFAGIVIVAGPWLLAIVGIFFIGQIAGSALAENRALFMAIIIYTYASSLFIFGGSHYIYTRFLSDLIYREENGEAGSSLVCFCLVILLISSLITVPVLLGISEKGISHPGLFKLASWLFYASVNILWVLMIFISLLKRYMAIFVAYLIGMITSIIGLKLLGSLYGLGGAMLGFALGQTLITVILALMALKEYLPKNILATIKAFGGYLPRYKYLFLSGLFFYWGIWIDKFVFWFWAGNAVEGTFFRLFETYDIPVYLSNLTMIPGLIYFVVISETDFYMDLKEFLTCLSSDIYTRIQEKKYALIGHMKKGLIELTVFQGGLTLVLILLARTVTTSLFAGSVDPLILRVVLLAVLFHFLCMTLMTFLYYLELYWEAAVTSAAFFLLNLLCSLAIAAAGDPRFYGLSYLVGGAAACVIAALFIFTKVKDIDRRIFSRYSSG